jgi:16S rRNA (guanine(966)-N(2))-methyltransferase RsmD
VRVIAGRFGGRRLLAPPASGVRPTADRVREAMFGALGDLDGVRVLDLYAGTGALGIEALSRGAVRAVFVERARAAAEVLRKNLHSLALGEPEARLLQADVRAALRRLSGEGARFELALLDPPYASGEVAAALAALVASGVLAPDAWVVVESARRHPVSDVRGLVRVDERRYGDTLVARFHAAEGEADRCDGEP